MHSTRYGRRRHQWRSIDSCSLQCFCASRPVELQRCENRNCLVACIRPPSRAWGEPTRQSRSRFLSTIQLYLASPFWDRSTRERERERDIRGYGSGPSKKGLNTRIGAEPSASIWGHRLRSTPTRTGVITRSFVHESAWRHAIA